MPIEVAIPSESVSRAFLRALALPLKTRGDFFSDLRAMLRESFTDALGDAGIATVRWSARPKLVRANVVNSDTPIRHRAGQRQEVQVLNAGFCAGYGIDEYSVAAINYLCGPYARLPALSSFLAVNGFSAGNIVVPLAAGSDSPVFAPSSPLLFTGHVADTGPRKRKPYVALLGVHFENGALRESLGDSVRLMDHDTCDPAWLDELRLPQLTFPALYICRWCGQLHSCECFRPHVDRDEQRRYLGSKSDLLARVENTRFIDGLCHLCRGGVPRHQYGNAMYYSSFAQRFLPYIELFARRNGDPDGIGTREAENAVRAHFGFPAIGERWTSETILFRVVEGIVAPREVIHHYRGRELEGLELDVWIPELRVGIEYQGQQHYQAIRHWGGEEGLAQRQANDRRKRSLCKRLGYTLIEFRHDEDLSEATIQSRLKAYLEPEAF